MGFKFFPNAFDPANSCFEVLAGYIYILKTPKGRDRLTQGFLPCV